MSASVELVSRKDFENNVKAIKLKTKFRGVFRCGKNGSKWKAQIQLDGKRFYLGIYDKEEDAAKAFDKKRREHFGIDTNDPNAFDVQGCESTSNQYKRKRTKYISKWTQNNDEIVNEKKEVKCLVAADLVKAGIVPVKSRRIDDEDKLRKAWMINRDLNHTIESAKSTQQSMLQNISQSYVYDEVAEAKRVLLTQLTGEIELLEERRLVVETEMNLALRLVTKIEDVVY